MHYPPRCFDVAHCVAQHVALHWICKFETKTIAFSVWQNLLKINFWSNHAVFHGMFRCRDSCRATLRNMLRNVAATTLKHVLLKSVYVKTSKILISARSVHYSPRFFNVAHRVAQHRPMLRNVAAITLKHILLYSAYAKTLIILISARSVQYSPSCFDVAHRIAQHCATLQLQLWNLSYCIQRMPKPPRY